MPHKSVISDSNFANFSKVSHAITVSNGGSGATKNIHFAVEKELADKVVFIEATSGPASDKTYLRVTETKLSSNKVGIERLLLHAIDLV